MTDDVWNLPSFIASHADKNQLNQMRKLIRRSAKCDEEKLTYEMLAIYCHKSK